MSNIIVDLCTLQYANRRVSTAEIGRDAVMDSAALDVRLADWRISVGGAEWARRMARARSITGSLFQSPIIIIMRM